MSSTPNDLYIDVPHRVSKKRRIGDAVVTGLMWIIYSYLWAPLISFVAWLLGFEFAFNVLIRLGGIKSLGTVFKWYLTMLVCIALVVAVWSGINRFRFAGKDRRKEIAPASDTSIAEHFGLSESMLLAMRSAKIMRVRLDDDAVIEHVESCGDAPRTAACCPDEAKNSCR